MKFMVTVEVETSSNERTRDEIEQALEFILDEAWDTSTVTCTEAGIISIRVVFPENTK